MKCEALVEAKDVTCKIGNRTLLNHVSVSIKPGEHVVLFGMNGCGKTTLLSILAGYGNYQEGVVSYFGEKATENNVYDIRKKIAWISSSFFEKYYRNESVLDIVISGALGTLGIDERVTDEDIVRAKQLLQNHHLQHRMEDSFCQLSKGEKQNVLIARAWMSEPEVLLLDEPGNGLDIYAREKLLYGIEKLAAEKKRTVVYVTHYTEEIMPCFENCILMKEGMIYQVGKTKKLMEKKEIEAFLGYPVEVQSM